MTTNRKLGVVKEVGMHLYCILYFYSIPRIQGPPISLYVCAYSDNRVYLIYIVQFQIADTSLGTLTIEAAHYVNS